MEKHNVSRLIGAPPGYIGYEEGGQLTEKIRRRPYSVVLLDEIEKAHPDVWNMLLQIMEEGRLTDNVGRIDRLQEHDPDHDDEHRRRGDRRQAGRSTRSRTARTSESTYDKMKETLKSEMEKNFRPEFLNRVDDIIVFRSLTKDDLKQIIDIELAKVSKRLKEKNLTLVLTDEAKELHHREGHQPGIRCPSAAPGHRAPARRPAGRGPAARQLRRQGHRSRCRVKEEDGEKKLYFDTAAETPPAELVGAGKG